MVESKPLRWLFLDLNSYFASVEQQLQPHLRGRPVIVAPVGADTTVAITASYEAKACGITTGTPVWEAKAKCRDLIVTPARHRAYVEFHERIVAEVWRHVPVTKVCSIDEVACRLCDNENGADQAVALAQRIKAGIAANVGICLRSSIGIAPNRLLAKLASDMQKPDGLVVLHGAELPARLFGLKLTDIAGVGAKTAQRLARENILSIEDFCARRPRDAGDAWGGVLGDRLWWLLHGHDLPDRATRSRSIGHSHVLAPDERDFPAAALVARRLALKAASRLRRGDRATRLVVLHALFEADRGDWRASLRLPATQDSFAILTALAALWPRLVTAARARPAGMRLRRIGVKLCELAPTVAEQRSLFAHLDPADPLARETRGRHLSGAMDRLNEKFGRNAVTLGPSGARRIDRVGTRIAFGRIPDLAEFHE